LLAGSDAKAGCVDRLNDADFLELRRYRSSTLQIRTSRSSFRVHKLVKSVSLATVTSFRDDLRHLAKHIQRPAVRVAKISSQVLQGTDYPVSVPAVTLRNG
jgi:PHP family Zn ribbon phosphoesterase